MWHGESGHTPRCQSAFLLSGRQNEGRNPGGFSPGPFSEAGRITPLALNIQMRGSEPEG
jgi:hypothetical protein